MTMQKEKKSLFAPLEGAALDKRRRQVEATATFGLILVAAALLAPFASSWTDAAWPVAWSGAYKWIYAAGALIYLAARTVNVADPRDSRRLQRLRRMEFWAGVAFCFGAFFWFYNTHRFSGMLIVGPLAIIRDTVAFSLAGAALQVIASWMIAFRQKKEAEERAASGCKKNSGRKNVHDGCGKGDSAPRAERKDTKD